MSNRCTVSMTSEIELIKNAAAGDRDSQFRLGRMYRDGVTIEKDVKKAIKWFTAAADSGHIRAEYELAILLEAEDPKKNRRKILKLLQDSAKCMESDAMIKLARAYRDGTYGDADLDEAIKMFRKCMDNGSSRAKLELAELLYKSEEYADQLECIKYCYELADEGDRDAMFRLYLCYRYAVGGKKNMALAKKWLKKAADAGHKTAKKDINEVDFSN